MHTDFSCPACAADLEVRERLEEPPQSSKTERERRARRQETFACPACSADLEVRERLSSPPGQG
jgi:transcription initiation factor IIE alpha subunit